MNKTFEIITKEIIIMELKIIWVDIGFYSETDGLLQQQKH